MDCSLPGSSVHGIFQAIVLEWIAISFSRLACIGPPQRPTLGWQQFSFFESRMKEAKCGKMIFKSKFLYAVMRENQMYFQGPRNLTHMCFLRKLLAAKSLQSCPTLCNLMDSMQSARLFCSWDSPGKNIGVGYHALLQGIFPTQGSNPHL